MKRLFPLVLLAACVPMKVNTVVDACPVEGLRSVEFRQAGALVPGEGSWAFSEQQGDVYLTCLYESGGTRRQKLPMQFKSCTRAAGAAVVCRAEL